MCNGQCQRAESVRITDEQIELRLGYHPAQPGQPELYEKIRTEFIELSKRYRDLLPPGRDARRALDSIEQAMHDVIAGVARNGVGTVSVVVE